MMKKAAFLCIAVLLLYLPCHARDYVVEFVEEQYKETQSVFSYAPVIYHSIQVNSEVGPKLLMLKGDDYHYRTWIREYIAAGKAFIVKVPDDQNSLFLSAKVFEIDIRMLHPLNIGQFREARQKKAAPPPEPLLKKMPDPKMPDPNMTDQMKPGNTGPDGAKEDLKTGAGPAPERRLSETGQSALNAQEESAAEIRQRLIEEERRIRLELDARSREMERRWQEIRQRQEQERPVS